MVKVGDGLFTVRDAERKKGTAGFFLDFRTGKSLPTPFFLVMRSRAALAPRTVRPLDTFVLIALGASLSAYFRERFSPPAAGK